MYKNQSVFFVNFRSLTRKIYASELTERNDLSIYARNARRARTNTPFIYPDTNPSCSILYLCTYVHGGCGSSAMLRPFRRFANVGGTKRFRLWTSAGYQKRNQGPVSEYLPRNLTDCPRRIDAGSPECSAATSEMRANDEKWSIRATQHLKLRVMRSTSLNAHISRRQIVLVRRTRRPTLLCQIVVLD